MNLQIILLLSLYAFNLGINPILLKKGIYKPKVNKEISEFCCNTRMIWTFLIIGAWFFKLDFNAILILFYVDIINDFLAAPYFFLYRK